MDLRVTEKKNADLIAPIHSSVIQERFTENNFENKSFSSHLSLNEEKHNSYGEENVIYRTHFCHISQEPSSSHFKSEKFDKDLMFNNMKRGGEHIVEDENSGKDSDDGGILLDDSEDHEEDLSIKPHSKDVEGISTKEGGPEITSNKQASLPLLPNLKPFQCPCCSYKASNPSRLKEHIVAKHTMEKLFQCPYCDYKTTHSGSLKPHIMAKHTNEKPHKCTYCEYKATTSSAVKAHIRGKHTNEKPHQCPYCDYKVAQACNLKRHIVHRHSDEKPHQCPHCEYSAKATRTLRAHIMAKHSYDKAQVQCPHCNHMAPTPYALRVHTMAVHVDIRPHACPHCPYRASQPGNLQRHLNTKHEHLQL